MADRGNRTVLCSVVFIDIVEYSKKSVEEQMRIKQRFNTLLLRALADVPADDRIILDTGDGAAINFLGDPEECLFVALGLRDALAAREDDTLRVRVGINLGPVRLIKDINGQPNIIGDGINVAQRIMSFADVDQILVSRSFYELISALSADYAQLFAFEGARTDKHVREHEVYAMGKVPQPPRVARKAPKSEPAGTGAAWRRIAFAAAHAQAHLMSRPPLATALAVVAILAAAIALRFAIHAAPSAGELEVAAEPQPVAAEAAAVAAEPPPPPPEPAPPEAEKPLPEPAAEVIPPLRTKPAAVIPPGRIKPPAEPLAQARAPREQPVEIGTGTVRLTIIPWGEIYVDGRKFGVTPPMHDIALNEGVHRIEIRNPGFASHVQVVEVKADEEIRIRHRFQ